MRSRRRPRSGPSVHLATDVPRTRCSRGWSRRSWQPGALISRVPLHGYLALGLIAAAWPASWLRIGSFGEYAFFPLWLGYILAVDALVLRRTAGSLLTRNRAVFAAMFLASIPLWWGFEGINYFTQNWHYLDGEEYSALKYALLASWHFSIVIPAVFETTELVGSLKFVNAFSRGPKLPVSSRLVAIAITGGMTALLAVLVWPQYAFPLTWLSVLLILDPINQLLGAAKPSESGATRGLETRRRSGPGRTDLRLVLGDVEFLGLSEVVLHDSDFRTRPHIRNAGAGLRRIHPLWPRGVRRVSFPDRTREPRITKGFARAQFGAKARLAIGIRR